MEDTLQFLHLDTGVGWRVGGGSRGEGWPFSFISNLGRLGLTTGPLGVDHITLTSSRGPAGVSLTSGSCLPLASRIVMMELGMCAC